MNRAVLLVDTSEQRQSREQNTDDHGDDPHVHDREHSVSVAGVGDHGDMRDENLEILRALAARPSATADEVTHHVGLSLDKVREALALLEEEGYIARTAAAAPHGELRYTLTSAGFSAVLY